MKAIYITNGTRVDYWSCPVCDEEMAVCPGQDEVDCPNPECEKKWYLSVDYSFEDGRWRNCSAFTERKT